MIPLIVFSLATLFALLSFSPMMHSDDAGEYMSAEIESAEALQA